MIIPWNTKRRVRHESLGPELISAAGDRTFVAGQGNWTVVAGNDVAWAGGDCDWTCDEANTIQLVVTLTEGSLYRLGFDISAYTSGELSGYVGGTSVAVLGEAVASFALYGLADSNNYIQFRSPDFIGSIDNVSIKEVL